MSKPLTITTHDGKKITVQPTLEDRLAFETTLRKHRGWGDLADNALKLEPFLAWNAATRAGKITQTWDEFTRGDKAAIDVEEAEPEPDAVDVEPAEVEGVEAAGKGGRKGRTTNSR